SPAASDLEKTARAARSRRGENRLLVRQDLDLVVDGRAAVEPDPAEHAHERERTEWLGCVDDRRLDGVVGQSRGAAAELPATVVPVAGDAIVPGAVHVLQQGLLGLAVVLEGRADLGVI